MTYQRMIKQIAPDINAAGVEAQMRLEHGTLDHLSSADFDREVRIARQCESASPGYLASVQSIMGVRDCEAGR